MRPGFVSQLKASDIPENTAAFFACSAGEQAYEHRDWGHGAFTKCLLEEIETLSAMRKVRMAALTDKVQENVETLVANKSNSRDKQTPFPLIFGSVDLQLSRKGPGLLMAPFDAGRARDGQAAWGMHLKLKTSITSPSGIELVLIPPGEYLRGSSDADVAFAVKADSTIKPESLADEQPQHLVRISKPFYMSKYEVTQGQFQKLMGRNPAYFSSTGGGKAKVSGMNTSQFPIETVTWYDCVEFCNKLSESEGKSACYELSDIERETDQSIKQATVAVVNGNGYRLPTEAEWEYACRAGTTTAFHFGNQLNGEQANVDGTIPFGTTTKGPDLERTGKVGDYAANQFGLHDVCGNVWEWCADGHHDLTYGRYSNKLAIDPKSGENLPNRVLRGGSWDFYGRSARSAFRNRNTPGNRNNGLGFRVVSSCGPRT